MTGQEAASQRDLFDDAHQRQCVAQSLDTRGARSYLGKHDGAKHQRPVLTR